MRMINMIFGLLLSMLIASASYAVTKTDEVALSVWVNEAIVSTYTYNYDDFLIRQRQIARYFTAEGWATYSKALQSSKLPETVKQNKYRVTAVAEMPPKVRQLRPTIWEASMPVLVVYENPSYSQKQTLKVTIRFNKTPSGRGVRGFAISALQTSILKEPCKCLPPPPGE